MSDSEAQQRAVDVAQNLSDSSLTRPEQTKLCCCCNWGNKKGGYSTHLNASILEARDWNAERPLVERPCYQFTGLETF
ncbi:MAG: hypothetical protein ABW125_21455, partial [Candidatus Thiodiazotropha lotti]